MNIEDLRDICMSYDDAEEYMPFGDNLLVFKVKGKIFLIVSLDTEELSFNVKCDPETAIELRERYTSVMPGYHMNKKHWNTIEVNGELSAAFIKEQIENSYRLVRGKK